jgi:hypothetical protein
MGPAGARRASQSVAGGETDGASVSPCRVFIAGLQERPHGGLRTGDDGVELSCPHLDRRSLFSVVLVAVVDLRQMCFYDKPGEFGYAIHGEDYGFDRLPFVVTETQCNDTVVDSPVGWRSDQVR